MTPFIHRGKTIYKFNKKVNKKNPPKKQITAKSSVKN